MPAPSHDATTVATTDSLTGQAVAPPGGDTAIAAPAPPPAPAETVYVDRGRRTPRPPPRRAERLPQPPAGTTAPPPASEGISPLGHVLPSGTTIGLTAIDSIHSHYNKVGDVVRARVSEDISADGKVVIPAGSIVKLSVTAIARAPERGTKGTLELRARDVEINGQSYPLRGRVTQYRYEMKARDIGAGEVAKTGAGAIIGAVVGHAIGGGTGTVVGAVGGGAAGAAVAAKEADRDIIVHAGAGMTIELREDFSRS